MADPRFFVRVGPFNLGKLAEIAGATLSEGADPEQLISDVAALDDAGPDDLSFLDNTKYLADFKQSKAGVCLVHPKHAERAPEGMALLLSETPYSGYARVAQAFYPVRSKQGSGIHQTAIIDETASIGSGAAVGPYAVIGANVEIGENCQISAHVVIEDGVVVGEATWIGPSVTLSHCRVGKHCQIHAGARLGNRGFGFALDPGGYLDVPQLGRVIIEDGVEIGANVTIDRGAAPDTIIGAGSKIDNLVQIGHNVQMGPGCVLVAQSGVAGSTKLGSQVMLAAQSGLAGHIKMGDRSQVAAKSGVMRDVPEGQTVGGLPAIPLRDYFKLVSMWQRQLKSQGKGDD